MTTLPNINTHARMFDYAYNDILLNELLWRADTSVNRLKTDLDTALLNYGYNQVSTKPRVSQSGLYINVLYNNTKLWHLSFHLQYSPILSSQNPGTFHIKSNIIPSHPYQTLRIIAAPSSVCDPPGANRLQFTASVTHPSSSSICGVLDPTIDIVMSVLNRYFNSVSDQLSLHHNLSNRSNPHPELMPIIRTRPTNITRTALTAGLVGGTHAAATSRTNTRRLRRRLYTRQRNSFTNNRTLKKNMPTYKSSNIKRW